MSESISPVKGRKRSKLAYALSDGFVSRIESIMRANREIPGFPRSVGGYLEWKFGQAVGVDYLEAVEKLKKQLGAA